MSKPFKMPMMNEVRLVGRVTRDPELKYISSGAAVLNFSIAVDEFWTDKATDEKQKYTSFFNCQVWGKAAEYQAKSLKKGIAVLVQGSLRSRSYEKDGVKHYVVEIRAQRVSTLEWESDNSGGQSAPSGERGAAEEPELPRDEIDSIPF